MVKIKRFVLLGIILIISIAACSGEAPTPDVVTEMEIITLQTTPSLEQWLAAVADCANDIPDFALTTQILPVADLKLDQADLILRLGERRENDPYVSVMGIETTVILAGSEVPVDTLSQNTLREILAGEITNWSEVTEVQNAGIEINQPITTLSYPEGHELRLLFQKAYLDGDPIASEPLVLSTEGTLGNLLETNPFAIGYTLESRMPPGAQRLSIRGFDEALAQHNVLAITPEEPSGKLRQLLLCLQN